MSETEQVPSPRRTEFGRRPGRLSLYVELRDLWVGVFVAPGAVYVCPLPCVVIRWERTTAPAREQS